MNSVHAMRNLITSTAVLMSLAGGVRADEAALRAEIAQLKAQVAELRAENAALRAQIEQPHTTDADAPRPARDQRIAELEAQNERLMRLAGVTPAGDLLDQAQARIVTKVDEATGVTTVTSPALALPVTHGTRSSHAVSFSYTNDADPQAVVMHIDASDTRGLYDDLESATIEVDGDNFTCDITDYAVRRVRTGGNKTSRISHREMVHVAMPLETAARVADGAIVTGQIGATRFALERDQIAIVKAMVMRARMLNQTTP